MKYEMRERLYRFDMPCHYCGCVKPARRYGFQWVCVDCEERDVDGRLLPYDERCSDRTLLARQLGRQDCHRLLVII